MANYMNYANATTLFTEIGNKLRALNGAYVIRGNSTFANLPSTLTKVMTGYVYNVTDEFTTTASFVEGAGKKYPAGTNAMYFTSLMLRILPEPGTQPRWIP